MNALENRGEKAVGTGALDHNIEGRNRAATSEVEV